MWQRENYYFYRCYNTPAPAPDAQPIAMVEFRAGGGGDGQPEVIFVFFKRIFFYLLNNLGGLRYSILDYIGSYKICDLRKKIF